MFNSAARVLMCLRGMGCVPASQWATCTCAFASGYPSARPIAFCVMPAASLARFKISFAGVDFTPILCYNVASKRVLDEVSPRAVRRQCCSHWRLFFTSCIQSSAMRTAIATVTSKTRTFCSIRASPPFCLTLRVGVALSLTTSRLYNIIF